MRIRGGRPVILPLLALFFTFALAPTSARADEPAPAAATSPAAKPPADAPPAATAAEEGDKPAAAAPVAEAPRLVPSLSHDLQFGLAVLFGDGYRIIFPYSSQPIDCGDANNMGARVCTNRAPSFIDLQPSFGISQSWDFLVDLRLGIEKDFNTFRQLFVMPGFRYWLDTQSHVKFFTTIQVA